MSDTTKLSRKAFIRNSALTVAGIAAIPDMLSASELPKEDQAAGFDLDKKDMILKNVRLETGFEYDGEEVVATKTNLFCVEVANGKITKIYANNPSANAIDAKGLLMLPVFKDMHIHLDNRTTDFARNA